jgi:hypothetical protein
LENNDLNEIYVIKITGLEVILESWIPSPLFEICSNSLNSYFIKNGNKKVESSGILVNKFESFDK